MRYSSNLLLGVVVGGVVCGSTQVRASQPTIVFTRVIGKGDSHPRGVGNFSGMESGNGYHPILRNKHVAFGASATPGPIHGIYVAGDTVRIVADSFTQVPDSGVTFSDMRDFGFDGQGVAFLGYSMNGNGLYADLGSGLVRIAGEGDDLIGQSASVGANSVTFVAGGVTQGIFTSANGAITNDVLVGQPVPGSSTTFGLFQGPFSDGTEFAFSAMGRDISWRCVCRVADHLVESLADTTMPIPHTTDHFRDFGSNPSYSDGQAAFLGYGFTTPAGIYVADGRSVRAIAQVGMTLPDGSGDFQGFSWPPSIHGANVAFWGWRTTGLPQQEGLYAEIDGEVIEVVTTDDILGSERPVNLHMGPGALEGKKLAFIAWYPTSSTLYIASICHPAPLLGDVNSDGQVSMYDVQPFIETLLNPLAADASMVCSANANDDASLDATDIHAFIELLTASREVPVAQIVGA